MNIMCIDCDNCRLRFVSDGVTKVCKMGHRMPRYWGHGGCDDYEEVKE